VSSGVGELATAVQTYLRDALAERRPSVTWETEYRVAGTPVDGAGRRDGRQYLVELEWRRADPADNTAKLFRHLVEGELDGGRVAVFQVFSGYYDLERGGVSSKRENAEFVGRVAADAVDRLAYTPVEFDLDPPKRGGAWPDDWEAAADVVVAALCDDIESD
jgi:hypothetical protein